MANLHYSGFYYFCHGISPFDAVAPSYESLKLWSRDGAVDGASYPPPSRGCYSLSFRALASARGQLTVKMVLWLSVMGRLQWSGGRRVKLFDVLASR